MILNLVPEFLDVIAAADPTAAYTGYLRRHHTLLHHYWHNYVLDLDSAPARDVIAQALAADRKDLLHLLETVDLEHAAQEAFGAAEVALDLDFPVDVVLTVGVGGANAGELVVGGRGLVIVCLEHFTGQANPETFALGLAPELLAPWIAHEVAHLVRYLSPGSRSDLRRLVLEAGGMYDCWEQAGRASLRELLINEGVAVHAARVAAPGHPEEAYYGYTRRQFKRLRELDGFLSRVARHDLEQHGLGLRLRWLTGGMTPAARMVGGRVLPERAGYYLGARLAEALVLERGVAAAARAPLADFADADQRAHPGRAESA